MNMYLELTCVRYCASAGFTVNKQPCLYSLRELTFQYVKPTIANYQTPKHITATEAEGYEEAQAARKKVEGDSTLDQVRETPGEGHSS